MKKALLLTVLTAMLSAAAVSAQDGPVLKFNGGYFCADHMMPATSASHVVLVTLQATVNGKPRNDFALVVKQWLTHKNKPVGYAHPACWTALPVEPGKPGHRPTLCVVVRPPFKAVSSGKSTVPAACPTPVTYRTAQVRWVTYTFRVAAG